MTITMRRAPPCGARLLLAVSVFATSALTAACSDEEGATCACDEPRSVVFVNLADAPVGGLIEAFHGDNCQTAPVEQARHRTRSARSARSLSPTTSSPGGRPRPPRTRPSRCATTKGESSTSRQSLHSVERAAVGSTSKSRCDDTAQDGAGITEAWHRSHRAAL